MTYREFIEDLKAHWPANYVLMANMIGATQLMTEHGPNAQVDQAALNRAVSNLQTNPTFRDMARQRNYLDMAKQGKGAELIETLGTRERQRIEKETLPYRRSENQAAEDAEYLNDALARMEQKVVIGEGAGKKTPSSLERNNVHYKNMKKAIETAKKAADNGKPLTGLQAKNLTKAITDYIDNSGQKPGPFFGEGMCLLKRFMPKQSYEEICTRYKNKFNKNAVNPDSFTHERLKGNCYTANEYKQHYMNRLKNKYTQKDLACLQTAFDLSKGKSGTLISREDFEKHMTSLTTKGSAFMRTLKDGNNESTYKQNIRDRRFLSMSKDIKAKSNEHAIRTAQGYLDKAADAMLKKKAKLKDAPKQLATIIAAHEMAESAATGSSISKEALQKRTDELLMDPAFKLYAERFQQDETYRNNMKDDLNVDRTGSIFSAEYKGYIRKQSEAELTKNQVRINRSINSMLNNNLNAHYSEEHIVNILAGKILANEVKNSKKIDSAAIEAKKNDLKSDPAVRNLAQKYASDPEFRKEINSELKKGTAQAGDKLQKEYNNIKNPVRNARPVRQPVQPQIQPQIQPQQGGQYADMY